VSKSTVTKYKWFWADQDLEQEQWLRELARQGLHLVSVVAIVWTFARGEPADIVYRVDYSSKGPDSDYNRLIEDAGWECATTSMGWHYWRKPVVDGRAPEIFTDNASKIARFQQVLAILIVLSVPTLLLLPKAAADQPVRVYVVMFALMGLYIYGAIRLLIRISKLASAGK
jgi:hypothetical protein